jgi:hypothetical protein
MPLAYRVLIDYQALGVWDGSTAWRWWIYLPVFALTALELRRYTVKAPGGGR